MRRRLLLLLLLPALVLAACGSDGGGDEAAAEGDEPEVTETTTIEHKYGTTEIEGTPERVVSIGFNDQDTILALGVVPIAVRDWFGDMPSATWPWAHDLLEGAEPTVLGSGDLDFEAIAALDPDLIVGVYSGITPEEYKTLSAIAPTVPQTDAFVDYGMPWQDATELIGQALGRDDRAQELIEEVEGLIAGARADHPEFEGATATVSYVMDDANIGAYGPEDGRTRLLTDLGFVLPEGIVEKAGDQFYSQFSWEEIGLVDEDVLVWIAGEAGVIEKIKAHPLRQQTKAAAEGREVFLTDMESGAASFSSVLSLPYLLETYVPKLAAAVDGDPATAVAD